MEYTFELIKDGEVIGIAKGFDELEAAIEEFNNANKNNRRLLSSTSGCTGFSVYLNEKSLKTETLGYRARSPFVDVNGKYIYMGDYLVNPKSKTQYFIHRHSEYLKNPNDPEFYMGIYGEHSWSKTLNVNQEIINTNNFEVRHIESNFPDVVCKI